MVEKPPEEGVEEPDDPAAPPVMVEKRVCEVANTCALNYEELMVVEAREVQLTEETLHQVIQVFVTIVVRAFNVGSGETCRFSIFFSRVLTSNNSVRCRIVFCILRIKYLLKLFNFIRISIVI